MHETINSNDASNEQLTRLRNIVWLWCISEGYEDVSTGQNICFAKNQKTTTFILETNKSRNELLTCIYETATPCTRSQHSKASQHTYLYSLIWF